MDPNLITYFGETDARNKKIRFGIKAQDRLRHMYVIGKTGMGKSTLLENLAIQDIQNGNGLAFIDPHGGTAEKLLDYVPENRIKDVLYFAPFDMEYPVSFNVLEDIGADKRHLVVNGLMSTFEKIWVDAWSARMAYILSNTLLALLEYPGATLLGVNRMLTDKDYRKKVVENITDVSVKTFWIEEYGKWTERFVAEAIPAIQNKVGQFTANPLVRNLLGQPESSFDIRKFMDEKKILIINMSKGLVGEGNARLIGSMLITKIYLAAMSRADKNEKDLAKLPNFYLYVDEFQSFANKSFADILSEARKYKLSLNIAHQYIEQMEEEVRDAVFGNVGTMVTFRVGAFDAEVLEKEFAPIFTAEDLVNLGFAQIYLKLMIDGVSSQPFSAKGMAPIARPEISFREQVIASSRAQFARPRAVVEKNVFDWHSSDGARVSAPALQPGRQPQTQSSQTMPLQGMEMAPRTVPPVAPLPRTNTFSRPDFAPSRPQQPMPQQSPVSQQPPARPAASAPVAPDPNKLAFMEAAKILQENQDKKENRQPPQASSGRMTATAAGEQWSHDQKPAEQSRPETISLNALKREDTKKPSIQNVSNLKNAIAEALKKQQSETPAQATQSQPVQQPKPEIKEEPKPEPKVEQKPEPKSEQKTEEKTEPKKEPEHKHARSESHKSEHVSSHEVPESVLREILSMDEKK
jgi:hypothetical protein